MVRIYKKKNAISYYKPLPGFCFTFRRPCRPEHTAAVPPLSHILETNRKRKQQRGQWSRRGRDRKPAWSDGVDSGGEWTWHNRNEVPVSEGFPPSILLPQEANTCPPTARQHRHQPCLRVRASLSVSVCCRSTQSSSPVSLCFDSQVRVLHSPERNLPWVARHESQVCWPAENGLVQTTAHDVWVILQTKSACAPPSKTSVWLLTLVTWLTFSS